MEFDIKRRETFDTSAMDYERYRPSYPEELIEDVINKASISGQSKILEVGSGTGKATVLFAKHQLHIQCVELGKNLYEVAQEKLKNYPRVKIWLGKFEEFNFIKNSFDLLVSAQAFHWITPDVRMSLAARALKPDGSLALFYNYTKLPADETHLELSKRLSVLSQGILKFPWNYEDDIRRWREEIINSHYFTGLTIDRYPWERIYSAEEYIGLFNTFSDFLCLEDTLKFQIRETIRDSLKATGNEITVSYDCVLFHAKRGNTY